MLYGAEAMLWGLAAVSVPVILHLTGRARPVVHRFPAMRFLIKSQKASTRALRLRHLLLLLLRMAALALLAFTLARPLWPWKPDPAAQADARARGDFVLLLDASLSMQYVVTVSKDQEVTRFEQAREQALRFLDRLSADSRVALIRATSEAESLQGRLTLNHDLVREMVRTVQPSGLKMDLGRALAAAAAIFERDPAGEAPRALLLFTDLQRCSIEPVANRIRGLAGGLEHLPPLVLVDLGADGARNGAVLSARLPSATLGADQTLTLTARIQAVDPARPFPVNLVLDGAKVAQQAVDPKGSAAVDVQFTFPAGAPGPHAGYVELAQSDALLADQQRAFTYIAGRPPRALVVERPGEAGGRGSGFFLRAALATASSSSATGLDVTVAPRADLDAATLNQYRLVILADAGDLGEAGWKALGTFVEEGGGLLVWLGPRTDPAPLRRHAYSDFAKYHGLLPGRLGEQVQPGKPQLLAVPQGDHPLLSRFPAGLQSALRSVKVFSYLKVTPDPGDTGCATVLELEDGSPLLLEKIYGNGRVLMATTGAEPECTSMLKADEAAVFLSLVLESCRVLAGRGEEAGAQLGRPLTLAIADPPPDNVVYWKPPGEAREVALRLEAPPLSSAAETRPPAENAVPSGAGARQATLVTPRIETVGVHRFSWRPPGSPTPRVILVAANQDEGESDLSRAKPQEACDALSPWPTQVVSNIEEVPLLAGQAAEHREFPVPLLVAVVMVLLLESFLSNRLYRQAAEEKT